MLLLVSVGDRDGFGIVDAFSELLAPPNGFELGALAREASARLLNPLSEVVETHSCLHERLAHLRHDGAAGITAWRSAAQEIAKSLANVVEHAGKEARERDRWDVYDIDLAATLATAFRRL